MRLTPVTALCAAALTVTSCTGSSRSDTSPTHPSRASAPAATPAGTSSAPGLAGALRPVWSLPLDAAMYARPLVAGTTAIAATENNSVYAVDLRSGRLRWHRHLAPPARRSELPCGNIDPSGITGTPAYDAAAGLVFVATESSGARHTLYALDARTGRTRWQRDLDVVGGRDPAAEQQRGALLVTTGRVYVPFGGRFGDCGNYVGYVAAAPVTGTGPTIHYSVPTAREAGIWAAGGVVVGPGGDLYVATGNGAETGGRYDGSDSVLRLSPALQRKALFAPSTWPQDNADDLDLGSMAPVVVDGHIVIAGKRGRVFLLPASLGGVGGDIAHLDGCAGYGSGAAAGPTVVLPCDDGVRAARVTGDRLRWLWHDPGVRGSPTTSGGQVFAFDGDDLVRLRLDDGRVTGRAAVGVVTRFAAAVPAGSLLLVGTTTRLVAVGAGSR